MVSPRPVPPVSRFREVSRRRNGLKTDLAFVLGDARTAVLDDDPRRVAVEDERDLGAAAVAHGIVEEVGNGALERQRLGTAGDPRRQARIESVMCGRQVVAQRAEERDEVDLSRVEPRGRYRRQRRAATLSSPRSRQGRQACVALCSGSSMNSARSRSRVTGVRKSWEIAAASWSRSARTRCSRSCMRLKAWLARLISLGPDSGRGGALRSRPRRSAALRQHGIRRGKPAQCPKRGCHHKHQHKRRGARRLPRPYRAEAATGNREVQPGSPHPARSRRHRCRCARRSRRCREARVRSDWRPHRRLPLGPTSPLRTRCSTWTSMMPVLLKAPLQDIFEFGELVVGGDLAPRQRLGIDAHRKGRTRQGGGQFGALICGFGNNGSGDRPDTLGKMEEAHHPGRPRTVLDNRRKRRNLRDDETGDYDEDRPGDEAVREEPPHRASTLGTNM